MPSKREEADNKLETLRFRCCSPIGWVSSTEGFSGSYGMPADRVRSGRSILGVLHPTSPFHAQVILTHKSYVIIPRELGRES